MAITGAGLMWPIEFPDFAALYRVPAVEPDWETATDEDYAAVPLLTPREALAMWRVADELAGLWEDAVEYGVIEMLPPSAQPFATDTFLRRLRQCFVDIGDRIAAGITSELDVARCTGDEWAVHRTLEAAAEWLESIGLIGTRDKVIVSTDDLVEDRARELLATWMDEEDAKAFAANVRERLLQDFDVEFLYDLPPDAFERSHPEFESFGFANLHPSQWFLPFDNVEDPGR